MEKVDKTALSETEEKILAILVKSDVDMTLEEVTEQACLRYGKVWKIQTVSTFLTRMQKKGYIGIYKVGRHSHYHPEISLNDYRLMMLNRVKDLLFGGSWENVAEFISYVQGAGQTDKERL